MTFNAGDIVHLGTAGCDNQGVIMPNTPKTLGGMIENINNIKLYWYPYQDKIKKDTPKRYPTEEIKEISLINVRNYYTCFLNHKHIKNTSINIESPRIIAAPVTSIRNQSDYLPHSIGAEVEVSAEICFAIKKVGKNVQDASDYILNYYPMISINDLYKWGYKCEPYTDQDAQIGQLYGRWGDGYQVPALDHPVQNLKSHTLTLIVSTFGDAKETKQIELNTDDYVVGAEETIRFISTAMTLTPGDIISLGQLPQTVRIKTKDGFSISLFVDNKMVLIKNYFPQSAKMTI
jgi:2-keto-4-pentenoate hydratase/2-oxohepta-3-ene-1,7-dioic acid hydratase in catechol pathway